MPSGKRESSQHKFVGALGIAATEEIRQRRTAAERTLSTVRARLGAPGTYGPTTAPHQAPGTGGTGSTTTPTAGPTTSFGDAYTSKKIESPEMQIFLDKRYIPESAIPEGFQLDPEKYTQNLEQSAEFRIASRLTAESEQMLQRSGPLWDEMVKNTQLPIIEGAGAMARENAEALRRSMARGGSARRAAFAEVQQIRERERVNSVKMQQLADSRLKLDKWARENARTQLEFNQNWAANLGGIREEFNSAMDRASELFVTGALPQISQAVSNAAQWRSYAHAKNRQRANAWISGAIGVASMAVGGLGMLGAAGIGGGFTQGISSIVGGAEGAASLFGSGLGRVEAGISTRVSSPAGY